MKLPVNHIYPFFETALVGYSKVLTVNPSRLLSVLKKEGFKYSQKKKCIVHRSKLDNRVSRKCIYIYMLAYVSKYQSHNLRACFMTYGKIMLLDEDSLLLGLIPPKKKNIFSETEYHF